MRCEICKELKSPEQVQKRANPYVQEMNNVTLEQQICDSCYEALQGDI